MADVVADTETSPAPPVGLPSPSLEDSPLPAAEPGITITAEGLFPIDFPEYLADPVPAGSLSASSARKLLPPHCPALFKWWREHPDEQTKATTLGNAAHKIVLGSGPEVVSVDADDWRTKLARETRDQAYADGKIPMLVKDVEVVLDMADAIRAHPIASQLLDRDHGDPEQSLFWQDQPTGVWRRCRLDWLPDVTPGRRLIVPDYKTSRSAEPGAFAKSAVDFGYHQQAAGQVEGLTRLVTEDVAVVFIVQETRAPYIVTVVELDPDAMRIGARLNRVAIDLYAECVRTNHWPSYSEDVAMVPLPVWYQIQHEGI